MKKVYWALFMAAVAIGLAADAPAPTVSELTTLRIRAAYADAVQSYATSQQMLETYQKALAACPKDEKLPDGASCAYHPETKTVTAVLPVAPTKAPEKKPEAGTGKK